MKPDQARVKYLFEYDSLSGSFTRKVAVGRHGRYRKGDLAGTVSCKGYRAISIDGVKYREHRVVWLYVTGRWPVDQIDHMDGNRSNNRFSNLREADSRQNSQNERGPRINNKSGYLGVSKVGRRWRADIKTDGKTKMLGYFDTPQLAHQAYLTAKADLHPYGTIS